MSKTIQELQGGAVVLNGLAEGMDELLSCETRAARNAVFALSTTLIEKSQKLADDLDAYESEARQ